ncbi:hypothetical protein MMC13_006492 [Lambiella insularis]|nr:hypothetical protein [Lambiella insularis]
MSVPNNALDQKAGSTTVSVSEVPMTPVASAQAQTPTPAAPVEYQIVKVRKPDGTIVKIPAITETVKVVERDTKRTAADEPLAYPTASAAAHSFAIVSPKVEDIKAVSSTSTSSTTGQSAPSGLNSTPQIAPTPVIASQGAQKQPASTTPPTSSRTKSIIDEPKSVEPAAAPVPTPGPSRALVPELTQNAAVSPAQIAGAAVVTATAAAVVGTVLSLTKGVDGLASGLDNVLRAVNSVESASNKLDTALSGNLDALNKAAKTDPAKPAIKAAAASAVPAAKAGAEGSAKATSTPVSTVSTTTVVKKILPTSEIYDSVTHTSAPTDVFRSLEVTPPVGNSDPDSTLSTAHTSTAVVDKHSTSNATAPGLRTDTSSTHGNLQDNQNQNPQNNEADDQGAVVAGGAVAAAGVGGVEAGVGGVEADDDFADYESRDEVVDEDKEEADNGTIASAPDSMPENDDVGSVYEDYDPENDELVEEAASDAGVPSQAVGNEPDGEIEDYDPENDEVVEDYDPDNDEVVEDSGDDLSPPAANATLSAVPSVAEPTDVQDAQKTGPAIDNNEQGYKVAMTTKATMA